MRWKSENICFQKDIASERMIKDIPVNRILSYQSIMWLYLFMAAFWHRHEGCKDATTPKTRTEFWLEKFDKNVKNDQIKQEKLRELGWKVIVIWECELQRSFQETMDKVEKELTRKPFIGAQN